MTDSNSPSANGQNMPGAAAEDQKDTAWVTIEIPVAPRKLFDFLQNTERMFRLNPYLDIREWKQLASGKQFHLKALNEMNGITYDLVATVEPTNSDTSMLLSYDKGLKRALEITLKPGTSTGSILTLREHYHSPTEENRDEQLKEVDHSLIHWASSIRRYLLGLEQWGWFLPYRWYLEHFWIGMRPFHRRIARMLLWVTIIEFVVFLFVFSIYWIELTRQH